MGQWETDVWGSIIEGWRASELDDSQWRMLLQLFLDRVQLRRPALRAANLLHEAASKERGGLTADALSLAETLADTVWEESSAEPSDLVAVENDWLTQAISHVGGVLTRFRLFSVSIRRAAAPADWTGLPEADRSRLKSILSGLSTGAAMGRVILASQIHFLFGLDREWTRSEVLSLLDWKRDPECARQAWEGYLHWGELHEGLLPDLLPLYEQA